MTEMDKIIIVSSILVAVCVVAILYGQWLKWMGDKNG